MGSCLFQQYNIIACLLGGDRVDLHKPDDKLLTAQASWQAIWDVQKIVFRSGVDRIPDALTPT